MKTYRLQAYEMSYHTEHCEFEHEQEFETLEFAKEFLSTYDPQPNKGCYIEVNILDDNDNDIVREVFEGADISGKLIVCYTHQTYLGYAHKYSHAFIAKNGMTESDLNPEAAHAFKDIDNDIYDDIQDFRLFGKRYRFTTSYEDWLYKIALDLGLSEEEMKEQGIDIED